MLDDSIYLDRLEFPNTYLGLVEVSMNGSSFLEIGVLIETNLVVVSFCIEGAWKATYYPAFNGNK